jgi:hypothetical protein
MNPVCTSQETHHVCATEPSRLMLFWERVTVYCDNHTEHTDSLSGQNARFLSKWVVHIITTDFKRGTNCDGISLV